MDNVPRMTGSMYFLQGEAGFMGIPVATVLIQSPGSTDPGDYLYMAILVGALMVAWTVTLFWARVEARIECRDQSSI